MSEQIPLKPSKNSLNEFPFILHLIRLKSPKALRSQQGIHLIQIILPNPNIVIGFEVIVEAFMISSIMSVTEIGAHLFSSNVSNFHSAISRFGGEI